MVKTVLVKCLCCIGFVSIVRKVLQSQRITVHKETVGDGDCDDLRIVAAAAHTTRCERCNPRWITVTVEFQDCKRWEGGWCNG
jgi:hypothetical protein